MLGEVKDNCLITDQAAERALVTFLPPGIKKRGRHDSFTQGLQFSLWENFRFALSWISQLKLVKVSCRFTDFSDFQLTEHWVGRRMKEVFSFKNFLYRATTVLCCAGWDNISQI